MPKELQKFAKFEEKWIRARDFNTIRKRPSLCRSGWLAGLGWAGWLAGLAGWATINLLDKALSLSLSKGPSRVASARVRPGLS